MAPTCNWPGCDAEASDGARCYVHAKMGAGYITATRGASSAIRGVRFPTRALQDDAEEARAERKRVQTVAKQERQRDQD
jgi:hypothetical protein